MIAMITKENIMMHELIGLDVKVVRSPDRMMVGTRGKVVDETRNTLVLESAGREIVVSKAHNLFRFTLPCGGAVDVDGSLIALQPWDRPKRLAARRD